VPDLVKSDIIFMTKKGLEQYEEVLSSRRSNLYRNRSVPLTETLPYHKYFGKYIKQVVRSKSPKDKDYESIIKPTLEDPVL
jgi:hypothetical protein